MASPQRLDLYLVHEKLARSRSQAQSLIRDGHVEIDGKTVMKPSLPVLPGLSVHVRARHTFASRAGLKLQHALDHFPCPVAGLTALDIGAAHGGFTDLLLHRGAAKIYAIDVGHDQLSPHLRNDPRVIWREGVNARYLSADDVPEPVDLIVVDVSFISLTKILTQVTARAKAQAYLVALIKPQFEAGPGGVGKGGIVRDDTRRAAAVESVTMWLGSATDWEIQGVTESPILGGDGNREYLLFAVRGAGS